MYKLSICFEYRNQPGPVTIYRTFDASVFPFELAELKNTLERWKFFLAQDSDGWNLPGGLSHLLIPVSRISAVSLEVV